MKILVTGAHFTPAVATIEQLKKIKGVEVVYVGRKTTLEGDNTPSVESQVFPLLGVKFIPLITGRLQRVFTIHTIPSLSKIPIGLAKAFYIIFSEKPDVVLSFGGYVAMPVVLMAWLWSIPIIVHEQTLIPGLANRISSFFADKIALSFDNGLLRGKKVVLTGNPLRREIIDISLGAKLVHPPGGQRLPVVLIMGGNQGSHIINLAVESCLNKLLKISAVYHQTGDSKYRDYERLGQLGWLGSLRERYIVKKWIGKEYGEILQKADLVVSRAGINILTELAWLGKPALLIPIPVGEQKKNAKYFKEQGLAKVISQSKLSGETLLENIRSMLNNLSHLKTKAQKIRKVIIPDAAKRLALETALLVKDR